MPPPPEPEKTGVQPSQGKEAGALTILPPEEGKGYNAMSETLATFVGTGIRPPAVPILLTYEKNAEERFRNVDAERRKALDDLTAMTKAYHEQEGLVIRYSERAEAGHIGSIGQRIMITVGAICAGAGISESVRPNADWLGAILLIIGSTLLMLGWGLAIATHRRNKDV